MKKLLTLTAIALTLILATPATAHAEARIDLSAHGGVGIGAMPNLDNEHGLVAVGFQMTWHARSWLELGMRINAAVAVFEGGSDDHSYPTEESHAESSQTQAMLVWHCLFVTRFHMGSRVRATVGAGFGHFFWLPGPAVAADLEVVLMRHGRHELSLRAGGDFAAIMGFIPYMSAHAGMAWSF